MRFSWEKSIETSIKALKTGKLHSAIWTSLEAHRGCNEDTVQMREDIV